MCSNPASISSASSCSLWAILQVKCSLVCRNMADSRVMYIMVLLMLLCPNICLTCMMSLVLWYSVVAFQCLNVWNVMCISLGLLSFSAIHFLWLSKLSRNPFLCGVNMLLPCIFGSMLSMPISLSLICSIRGLLPFSGVMLSILCGVSRSFHVRRHSSPIRMAVSLSVCSVVLMVLPLALISASISSSVGMNGSLMAGV